MQEKLSHDHHYCPIFYLQGFTNSKGKTFRFDKINKYCPYKEVFPKQVMFEKDMNNFDSILGTSSELEDVLFKQLDNKWSLFIKKLQSTNDISQIDQQDYTLLSQFIAWQYIRSPFMRDEFNRMKENQHKLNNFIERFKLVTKLHSSFYKKALTFNWLRDESEFLTSDNPCFLYSSYPIQFMTITKKLTITWEDSEKLIIYKNDQNRVFANEINKLIASDARRYVIGSEKNILEEAVEQTKHHPGFLEKI